MSDRRTLIHQKKMKEKGTCEGKEERSKNTRTVALDRRGNEQEEGKK